MPRKSKSSDAVLEENLSKFDQELNKRMRTAQSSFELQLSAQVKEIVAEISGSLGGGSLSNAVTAGFGQVANSLARGQKIDKRSVANAVAKSFAPDVADFFKQSSSQMADDISGFLGFGGRNN